MAARTPVTNVSSSSSAKAKLPTSSHRLPTISAAEAFQNLSDNDHGAADVLTGISSLDKVLGAGFETGKVTELWGPTGAGKTAIALKAAESILQSGDDVVWIDAAASISLQRLRSGEDRTRLTGFHHAVLPTLPHLLALLLHPPEAFPPPRTRLLVLTNLHTSLEASHPRNPSFAPTTKTDIQKWAAGRRYAVLGSTVVALNKLAAFHNIPIIVTTGCATRMRTELGPSSVLAVVPGVGGGEWDVGIWTRVAVFHDYNGHFVGVQKQRGVITPPAQGAAGILAQFAVDKNGVAVEYDASDSELPSNDNLKVPAYFSPIRPRKRAYEEVADSDDDDRDDEFGHWIEMEDDVVIVAEGQRGNDDAQSGATTS